MSRSEETRPSRRTFLRTAGATGLVSFLSLSASSEAAGADKNTKDTENRGDTATLEKPLPDPALTFPGVWSFGLPRRSIILVSDAQLEQLQDPDAQIDLSLSSTPNVTTLRKICEEMQWNRARTLILAFDEFWSQYRPGQGGKPRKLRPDTPKAIEYTATISRFAAQYGIGLELSLLSPLELGTGFRETTGKCGRWVQYREGYRDPLSGQFSVSLWEHQFWTNNKGKIALHRSGVRVFAFRERRHYGTPYSVVDPSEIVELKGPFTPQKGADPAASWVRTTVCGTGHETMESRELAKDYDRVLVVFTYETPEMDYFCEEARPFLENLVDRYHDAGVELNALYSDEIHIQQDWNYFGHLENGQFTLRYLPESFVQAFTERYGADCESLDFMKYLVYFCYGQHDFLPTLEPRIAVQHILPSDETGVWKTALFRRRYYDMLHQRVTDLFAGAKRYAESVYGKKLLAIAHATWAQSPTIDSWNNHSSAYKYEYTSDFQWSNTVHQASAACDDYFRWNDFLTGGGNDHAEGGWSDRNYYGEAIASSTGSLNDLPNAYAGAWGMPGEALARHRAIQDAYGNAATPPFHAIENAEHRSTEVLMLYPISLVATEERFGSWMVQYGYANYITAEKLLQYGAIGEDGSVDVRGRKYTTICALFEPLPPEGLLPFLEEFVARGGRLVWSGPPAELDMSGASVSDRWLKMFGLTGLYHRMGGNAVPGRRIIFDGILEGMEPQTILTDFLVDRVYPVAADRPAENPEEAISLIARIEGERGAGGSEGEVVGVVRRSGLGTAMYLGFRPRDDQSASLGYETRTWFEILSRIGAYPKSDATLPENDHPTVISRTTPYLATRFPNGTIALAAHYSRHRENWPGGFHRDTEVDRRILEGNPLPSEELRLHELRVAGYVVTYHGNRLVAFRTDDSGNPIAFGGYGCHEITIDGRTYHFADAPMSHVAWAPVAMERRVPGGAILEIWTNGQVKVRIPFFEAVSETAKLVGRGVAGKCGGIGNATIHDGVIEFTAPPTSASFWLLPE
ncbi:MAG: hypothetical protein Q4C47_00630 [Planctomycetia bacterium]|nr:hypothetical protein [Planctomycetia bacterium]